ncbi:hypothetical protein V6N13_084920 [Hibiscus sabdariffa]|uniref:Uncharacterized protein n=1 Tax=Hibiscus sabdariffa TaxID=183260 RepID=A0ABR2D001_9ROSI
MTSSASTITSSATYLVSVALESDEALPEPLSTTLAYEALPDPFGTAIDCLFSLSTTGISGVPSFTPTSGFYSPSASIASPATTKLGESLRPFFAEFCPLRGVGDAGRSNIGATTIGIPSYNGRPLGLS